MTKFKVIDKKPSKNGNLSQKPLFKRGKNEFLGKNENVTLLSSLILSYMQKIRKIYRADFRENRGRETERQTERQTETDPNIRVLRTLSRRTKKCEVKI